MIIFLVGKYQDYRIRDVVLKIILMGVAIVLTYEAYLLGAFENVISFKITFRTGLGWLRLKATASCTDDGAIIDLVLFIRSRAVKTRLKDILFFIK